MRRSPMDEAANRVEALFVEAVGLGASARAELLARARGEDVQWRVRRPPIL